MIEVIEIIHEMKLNDEPFTLIKAGTKVIELRLNDEKRRKLAVGDKIEFTNRDTNEKIMTEVIKLHNYQNFEELYKHFDKISLGYSDDEVANPNDMNKYYKEEDQNKYGVVGIEIKLIK